MFFSTNSLKRLGHVRLLMLWLALVILFTGLQAPTANAADPIRVLILTGRNNHDWKSTTQELQRIYGTGGFEVRVTEDPASLQPTDFEQCDVLVDNWCAFPDREDRSWGEGVEKAVLDFVRNGGGFVLFHAASATFYTWDEFHKMIGATWGESTGHGPVQAFPVFFEDDKHPVTQGLRDFWIRDELWHRMDIQPGVQVLASALSAASTGGSGEREPVVLVNNFGKGRVFHLVLGHDAEIMRNPAWQNLMRRGTEWAATANVTIPPSRAWSETRGDALHRVPNVESALEAVRTWRFGDDRAPLRHMAELCHFAPQDEAVRIALAEGLMALLDDESLSDGARDFVFQQVSMVGQDEVLPTLVEHLNGLEEPEPFMPRFALERIPGVAAAEALTQVLQNALTLTRDPDADFSTRTLVGLINARSVMPDERRPPVLQALYQRFGPKGRNLPAIASACAAALNYDDDGLLRVAEDHAAEGRLEEARAVYASLFAPDWLGGMAFVGTAGGGRRRPDHVRVAALSGLVANHKEKAVDYLRAAVESGEPALAGAVAGLLRRLPEDVAADGARQVAFCLARDAPTTLPAATVTSLIDAASQRGAPDVLPILTQADERLGPEAAPALLRAVGRLGDAGYVAKLAGRAADEKEEDAVRDAARWALRRIQGEQVEERMKAEVLQNLDTDNDEYAGAVSELLSGLADRHSPLAAETLIAALGAESDLISETAAEQLAEVGGEREIGVLWESFEAADSDETRAAIASALIAIGRRGETANAVVAPVAEGLDNVSADAAPEMLRVLGALATPEALNAVAKACGAEDEDLRQGAVRALAKWNDPAALEPLLAVARDSQDEIARILALRGFARLAGQSKDLPGERMTELVGEALALEPEVNERRSLVGVLSGVAEAQAVHIALEQMEREDVRAEAALAAASSALALFESDPSSAEYETLARSTADQVEKAAGDSAAVADRVEAIRKALGRPRNIAGAATASSPDDLEKDGAAGGDEAVNDGNLETFWDEEDNREGYRIRLTFDEPTAMNALAIEAYVHHEYSPRSFEIICDGAVVKTVRDALYHERHFQTTFPAATCEWIELHITEVYGKSPAIRELEIFNLTPEQRKQWEADMQPVETNLSWEQTDASLALMNGDAVVWRFNADPGEAKTFFHPVSTIDGHPLTWLKPEDHVWHRAHWFTWKFINGVNYWEENPETGQSDGRTELLSWGGEPHDDFSARITLEISYHPPDAAEVLREQRVIEVSAPDETGRYRFDWRHHFTAGDEPVVLDRTPIEGEPGGVGYGGYAGLSVRIAKTLTDWQFYNSNGQQYADTHKAHARWMDFSGNVPADEGEQAAGIAMFDHPSNPRHPSPWYLILNESIPFGYFSPALLFYESMRLEPGENLDLLYRVLVHPGRTHQGRLDREWETFAESKGPVVAAGDPEPPAAEGPPSYHVTQTASSVALTNHGEPVWQLNWEEGAESKPFLHPLALADGTTLTLLRPADHIWHLSTWFSWKYLNGVNYWEIVPETGLPAGRTRVEDVNARTYPEMSARVRMRLSYYPAGESPALTEQRTLNVGPPDAEGRYWIDWMSVFEAPKEDVTFDVTNVPFNDDGSPKVAGGYGGLAIRMRSASRAWQVVNADGLTGWDTLGAPSRWLDFSLVTDDDRVGGIAVLDHPESLRHPTPWCVRWQEDAPYGFFNPSPLFKEPYTLKTGETFMLRYRIGVHPGRVDSEWLDAEWSRYAQDLKTERKGPSRS